MSLPLTKTKSCNRCGACCRFLIDGKVVNCPNLIFLPSGKTICRIWNKPDRVGSVVYNDGKTTIKCLLIEDVDLNFLGCPFNKDGAKDADLRLQPFEKDGDFFVKKKVK